MFLETMDHYSAESTRRSRRALEEHLRDAFIAPVSVMEKRETKVITEDELPGKISIEHIYELSPSFKKDGRLTAATASGFADGAAAVILASEKAVKENQLSPIARIVAHSVHSQEPELFGTAPAKAVEKVLKKAGWTVEDVGCFEINEALAPVPMTAMKELHSAELAALFHEIDCYQFICK